jgi:GyrI-like small molecule binding domain
MSAPEIVTRAEQPYVAIRGQVSMAEVGPFAGRTGEVFAWLGARGLAPAGPPFLKYNVIDMARQLKVEAGVPVAVTADGDGQVISGVLPAGRYATVTHVGHPARVPPGRLGGRVSGVSTGRACAAHQVRWRAWSAKPGRRRRWETSWS